MKLNLGCSPEWSRPGWHRLDHHVLKPFSLPPEAWDMPFRDEMFEVVFTSHMIEHISHFRIEKTLAEINRVMKPGGILRLLTPDLEKLCRAYVERDLETLQSYVDEDRSGVRADLGPAQTLLGFLYSPGYDNFMLNSSRAELIGCYAHVFSYDFELLSGLLKAYGFIDVRKMSVDESEIADHKELRDAPHDVDRGHSLVVECRKGKYVPFDVRKARLFSGPYKAEEIMLAQGPKFIMTKLALRTSAYIENFIWWAARSLKNTIRGRSH